MCPLTFVCFCICTGAAKGLLLTRVLLRLAAGPEAALAAGGGDKARLATADITGAKPEDKPAAANAAATKAAAAIASASKERQTSPQIGDFTPQHSQTLQLRALAAAAAIAASTAAAAPRVIRFVGAQLERNGGLKRTLGSGALLLVATGAG